ncbi:MAG: AraC family transcriptional regulator [Solirubrobacteraceae bacterium]
MDVLTDLLQRSRARGAAFSRTSAHGDWGLKFPGSAPLSAHALVAGEAFLWSTDPQDALRVFAGDVVLVREHIPHHLAHAAGTSCVALADAMRTRSGVGRRVTVGDPVQPLAATFFCGAYRFEGDLCQSMLAALPDTLRVRPAAGSTLRATMDLIAGEMLRDQPGQQALLDRLLDVALVQILREHFSTAQATAPGWFSASADPRIGPALQALHAQPAHPWTVAELAEHALLSRSAFARQFTELLGVPPLTYLNDWRMALARERLRGSDARLASIGASLGYASEFSFAAAFKRHHGTAPGRWRRQATSWPS